MSGGSYNYLCHQDASDLFDVEDVIQRMADRLAQLGYASDAAEETQSLLLVIRQSRNQINARVRRLSGIWKAVEWWDSGDFSEESVKCALEEYRK